MIRIWSLLRSPLVAEWASAAAVVLVSALVGAYARGGMNPVQWLGGLAAILGSIGWAVIVRAWPSAAAAKAPR